MVFQKKQFDLLHLILNLHILIQTQLNYEDKILDNLIDVKDDGSFWLDQTFFNYCTGLTLTNEKFHNLFGAKPISLYSPLLTLNPV